MINFCFKYKDKKFNINVKRFLGIRNFTSGLMFLRRERAKALLFDFRKPSSFYFTSWFVFFSFLMVWLDKDNNVLKFVKVKPFVWKIPSIDGYYSVLEIPLNNRYKDFIKNLVGAPTRKTFKKN